MKKIIVICMYTLQTEFFELTEDKILIFGTKNNKISCGLYII